VRLDEARQHDHPAAFYHLRTAGLNVAADRDDRALAHVHVCVGQVAHARIHGHHVGVADKDLAALGKLSGRAARACAREICAPGESKRAEGGDSA